MGCKYALKTTPSSVLFIVKVVQNLMLHLLFLFTRYFSIWNWDCSIWSHNHAGSSINVVIVPFQKQQLFLLKYSDCSIWSWDCSAILFEAAIYHIWSWDCSVWCGNCNMWSCNCSILEYLPHLDLQWFHFKLGLCHLELGLFYLKPGLLQLFRLN